MAETVGEVMKEEGTQVDTKNLQMAEVAMVFFVSSPTFLAKVPFDTLFISSPSEPTPKFGWRDSLHGNHGKQPSHSNPLLSVKIFNALSLKVENREEEIIRKSKAKAAIKEIT
ncbi:hypothetical protein R3W88_010351 [Solanum pinnatisectum]|uniref:Uncharacterized protein n=1 Tax=Solanum pinnatisectum TaxID=50273 RepID=A0AAV9MDJ4_9SOLN|nr:hypothetical protein R3W88_010351 [Solanum pinnatisectum]